MTHLFNAMTPMTHREPGLIGAALDNDEVGVELITDGAHVHPAAVRAAFRLFENRIILVSAACPPPAWATASIRSAGRKSWSGMAARPSTRAARWQATAVDLFTCMRRAVEMGVPLGQAVRSASTNPARRHRHPVRLRLARAGQARHILLLDDDLSLNTVILRGQIIEAFD